MQRDEGDLLDAWVRHHVSLFGPKCVFVFDNGSQEGRTKLALQNARDAGVSIIAADGPNDFERKGLILTEFITRSEFDWFFPLDCDELLGVDAGGDFRTDRRLIEQELRKADDTGLKIARVERQLLNRPHTTKGYWSQTRKVAIKPTASVQLDLGFHLYHFGEKADIVPSETIYVTKLAYLHFHHRPLPILVQRARLKLKDRVPDYRLDTLKAYKGAGSHLAPYFSLTEEQYLKSMGEPTTDISGVFEAIGLPVPYAEPSQPLSEAELRALYHPVNLHRMRSALVASPAEIDKLLELMEQSRRYFEYGAGGSTAMACVCGVQRITSVETSVDFCASIIDRHRLRKYIDTGRLRLRHVDIGDTVQWGFPKAPPADHRIEAYLAEVEDSGDADLMLIDGRYRVAAAASAYLAAGRDTTIVIHDYTSRAYYHRVREFLELVESVEELAVFRPVPGKSEVATAIRREFFRDAR
jgi:hypothetical protein